MFSRDFQIQIHLGTFRGTYSCEKMGAESTSKTTGESGDQVVLNVYDLTPANNYSYWFGFGIFHSGLEGDFYMCLFPAIFLFCYPPFWFLPISAFEWGGWFYLVFCAPYMFVKMSLKRDCRNHLFSFGIFLSIWFRMELNPIYSMEIR